MFSMCTYCVLQGTDLSLLAHWDRDCMRTREVSNSYQHIATLRVCVVLYAHCVTWLPCAHSVHFLYVFVFKCVHIVACCAMQVLPCGALYVCVCVCACAHLKLFCTIRPDAGQNEHGPPVMALAKLKQHTQDIRTRDTHWQMLSHTHTNEHTSTSWPNYTEMRNEMETNLPREPANLEGLKDTLAHRTHTHLHTYVSGYLEYQNIMFRYDIIWKRNLSAQVKPYLTLSKLCHCIKLVW